MIGMLEKLTVDNIDMEIEEIEEYKDEDGDRVMKDHDIIVMDDEDGQAVVGIIVCDIDTTTAPVVPPVLNPKEGGCT